MRGRGGGEDRGAGEQRKGGERGGGSRRGEEGGEEVERAWILVRLGRDCLVVTPDLCVVAVLELERELHQGVGDVSRGLIGDGELVLLFCSVFASHGVTRRSRPWCGSS